MTTTVIFKVTVLLCVLQNTRKVLTRHKEKLKRGKLGGVTHLNFFS
jgi:hypothetical protein